MKKIMAHTFLSLLLMGQTAMALDLGKIGATYPVIERDALTEVEERAKAVDWNKAFDRKRLVDKIRNYRPEGVETLSWAQKDRVFQVDMSYTLGFEIPDGKGGVLYPRGFSFNPLAYVFLPNTLVVIDGDDAKQVEWFKRSTYSKDSRVMLLLSRGSYWSIMEKLKRPVFYADARIQGRFQLKSVPAVIVQKGTVMEVREYALNKEGRNEKK